LSQFDVNIDKKQIVFFVTKKLSLELNFKKAETQEQNKKDNPKEIFYEFLKLFRKQKKKIFSSSAELFEKRRRSVKKSSFFKTRPYN
jgi:RNase P/RNase MRP subunit p30